MLTQSVPIFSRFAAFVLVVFCCVVACAQQPSLVAFNRDVIELSPATPSVLSPQMQTGDRHRFWDKENSILFALNASFGAADFAITRANLQGGGQELNPVTRVFGNGTTGLAVNFAGQTAAVVGISYMLHKTGHHKLERAISIVNIGGSATAVSYDLARR